MTYSLDYRLTIICNDITVLDLVMSDLETCTNRKREYWLRTATMTSFNPDDTASDFYCGHVKGTLA